MTQDSSCGGEQGSPQRPMGIFWDIKSCPIPAGVNPADLPKNILAYLRHYLPDYCPTVFFAYGDPGDFPSHLLSLWERDGLTVHNVVVGGGSMGGNYHLFTQLIDLAIDHPRPRSAGMVVISQDPDHRKIGGLRALGHRVVLIYPWSDPRPLLSPLVWFMDWLSVANGSGQISLLDDQSYVATAPVAVDG